MTTKSLKEQFNRELEISKIPYKELATKETLEIWFKQFCKAPKIPSYWLYRLQYYSDEQQNAIIENNNERIPTITNDSDSSKIPMASFYTPTNEYLELEHLYSKFLQETDLNDKFLINDITQTPISKTLKKIKDYRTMFLDSIYDESTDRYKEPLEVSKAIIKLLEQLPFSLSSKIIEDIKNDDINMLIFIIKEFGGRVLNEAQKNKLKRMNYALIEKLNEWKDKIKALPPQQTEKPKPELNEALISFRNTEIIEKLHNELKGYFQGKEAELKKALQGKQLQELLLFPHNQNKFVEVFKRLKYNGLLISTPKETKDWICSNFTYQYRKGNKKEVREFNPSTVHDILTKDKGEPTKKERICIVDWLPYKSYLTRKREAEKENI